MRHHPIHANTPTGGLARHAGFHSRPAFTARDLRVMRTITRIVAFSDTDERTAHLTDEAPPELRSGRNPATYAIR